MNTKKRILSIAMAGVMVMSLCGCMAQEGTVTLNKDGSGNVSVRMGYSESFMLSMGVTEEELHDEAAMAESDMVAFAAGGKTYYGSTIEKEFKCPSELTFEFTEKVQEEGVEVESSTNFDFGDVTLVKTETGFTLTIDVGDTDEMAATAAGAEENDGEDITEELGAFIERYKDDFYQTVTFNMPGTVTQTSGTTNGVKIEGKTLSIDYVEMYDGGVGGVLTFDIAVGTAAETPKAPTFTDVPATAWCYNAIEAMYKGGLVSGYGNGMFGPYDTITVAQFCQILARATGMETGAGETGWWAEIAVESCIKAGYIAERGDVNRANYDVAISREEAIATLQKVSNTPAKEGMALTINDIPDAKDISPEFQDLVVAAFNSGITSGVDAQHTFLPKRTLTRAEVCQLFYNVNYSAIK